MKIKEGKQNDYDSWFAKNQDGYGRAIFTFANRWAEMLEEKIKTIGDPDSAIALCAEKTSFDADTEGITGFMYGAAVSILAECWEYGEVLRKWHNKEYDYLGEGVINPAILCVAPKGVQEVPAEVIT